MKPSRVSVSLGFSEPLSCLRDEGYDPGSLSNGPQGYQILVTGTCERFFLGQKRDFAGMIKSSIS